MTTPLLTLSDTQRAQLKDACHHHPKAYVREKCAALLKIAQGRTCAEVAKQGLLTPHAPDTLTDWRRRYQQEGMAGLVVQKGRGRKPAFSPSLPLRGAGEGADTGSHPS